MSADPLLCDPKEKAEFETQNGVDQLDYITYLVTKLEITELRETHVLDFQKYAVQGIYPCAGNYRTALSHVEIKGSGHRVPHESLAPSLVRDMVERINTSLRSRPAIERAAYALWRVNWIHPFAGGNGRTARAVSYLILCMDMGSMIPGSPTVPTLIHRKRQAYVEALKASDASVNEQPGAEPDLSLMAKLLEEAVTQQMASAIDSLTKPTH